MGNKSAIQQGVLVPSPYSWASSVTNLNGGGWDLNRIDANPQLEEVEIWTFRNPSSIASHPMHLHAFKFQILDRNGEAPFPYERGFKDVFSVGANETVRVIGRFRALKGKFMYHCHNMVHEDRDMMSQFEVGQGGINMDIYKQRDAMLKDASSTVIISIGDRYALKRSLTG